MKEKFKQFTFKLESSFFLTVIRHGLAMMIPFVLTGGIASAILNFPLDSYQRLITDSYFEQFLNTVYTGTFGLFSLAMVISLSTSFCMERNMTLDKTIMYILVALGSFGSQFYTPGISYDISMIGVKGCFFAIVTALLSCYLLEKVTKLPFVGFREYTSGMERITSVSISMLIPAAIVICIFVFVTEILLHIFDVTSLYELVSNTMCGIFEYINNEFAKGLVYTLLLHIMWAFGLHGSHILEPVATTSFALGASGEVFSKSFFDSYVVMGGCGTTICVFIAIWLFFRKTRLFRLAQVSVFTVVFNLNEILTFGIPILLNPILIIPFILTPVACYIIAFTATSIGLVPPVMTEIPWSTPILFSGYMATGSIRGSLLQLFLIAVGVAIYVPFIRMNLKLQEQFAKDQISDVVKLLQEKEELNENFDLLSQSKRIGQISRMLKHDLKSAIDNDELYLLYQPQVDDKGVCIGAEALLRWNHPLYGFIYPPLIIYLAKEGNLLERLEKRIISKTISSIATVQKECGNDFKISMNLTAKSLLWNIEEYIDKTLKEYNVEPSKLWIEITEQDVLSKAAIVVNKLERLKAKGHVMMIDDFGMGHTSILYLQSSSFGVVKLDGSLVKDVLDNTTNQQIISSIVALAEKLNIKIIAEYVEEEKQRDKLLELGCKWYQGYLYDRPVPLEDFIEFMKAHSPKNPQ